MSRGLTACFGFVVALVVSARLAGAETVAGTVVDSQTREPVAGAVVTAAGESALTDERGRFVIEVEAGAVIIITAARYAEKRLESATRVVELERSSSDSGEVIEIKDVGPVAVEAPSYELTPEVIRLVPGSGNDALKSLQTMPSVARVPFGMGGLVLRGTSPRDSSVFLDGIEVPLLYHFGGLTSFYPSSLLSSMELTPGGYSAEFGRGQGGVVVLESKPGRGDRWRVASELSMIDAAVRADGPAAGGTWSIAVRRSLVDAFLPIVSSDEDLGLTTAPRYYDAQLRYEADLWRGAKANVMLFGSDDQVSLLYGQNDDKTFTLRTRFLRLGVRLEQRVSADTELSVTPWVGLERFHLASTFQTMTVDNAPMGGRAELKHLIARGHVRGGVDVGAGNFEADSLTIDDEDDSETMITAADSFADVGLWLEASLAYADRQLIISPGLRGERYALSRQFVLDPRLVVNHDLGRFKLRESVGLYHQPPTAADTLWGNDDLEASYSIQSTLGGELTSGGTTVAVTGFYSELYNLPVDDPTADDDALNNLETYKVGAIASTGEFMAEQFGTFSRLINRGRGRNIGIESMVRHVGERGFAWLAYTIARGSRRDQPSEEEHPYILDQTHVVTAVVSRRLGKSWRLGARARLATGNPFTPVIGATPLGDDEFDPIYGDTLSERLPFFFQLDVRVDRVWKRRWGTIGAFIDVQNLSRKKNVEGRVYSDDYTSFDETRGLPLFPSFGVEYTPAP